MNKTVDSFIQAACVPLDSSHASGTLDRAEEILAADPGLATSCIQAAAILGDHATVERFITEDPQAAISSGGLHGWDPLTYLCFSRYLRLDPGRSAGFIRAARALLNAGASANTGFYSTEHGGQAVFESALYGAAGIAHHPELTRLLLEHGADPNDDEVAYHTPETYDNRALHILVESGKLTRESLATILLRKADWHDYEGIKWLLGRGADPNTMTPWGKTALHNAILSDNALEIVEVLLDHGADATLKGTHPGVARSAAGATSFSLAARRGRGDVLELFERRGVPMELEGVELLMSACARGDRPATLSLAAQQPDLLNQLKAEGGRLLARFAGNGNAEGVRLLIELGIDVGALYEEGDGYFDVARNSTALHVAAWRARHETVKLLIERGARVNQPDGRGRTPLALAVRACVDSYWAHRRSPDSVRSLLDAGASLDGVRFPSGYEEIDDLLRAHGAR